MKRFAPFALLACFSFAVIAVQAGRAQNQKPAAAPSKAAEKAEEAPKEAAKKPKGRLPGPLGKLALSDEQKTKVYEIQEQYQSQIEPLLAQIAALELERDTAIESVLSEAQKQLLAEIREQAKKDAEAKKKKAATKTTKPKVEGSN